MKKIIPLLLKYRLNAAHFFAGAIINPLRAAISRPYKTRTLIGVTLICIACMLTFSGCMRQPPEVLRLHVIANSDSDEDQQVKYKVRDAVRDYLGQFAGQATDISSAYGIAGNNKSRLESIAVSVLDQNAANYKASVMLGEYDFPAKVYGDTEYPAGRYKAVKIVLGEGQGKNWWCVLFPPLCIVDSSQTLTTSTSISPEPSPDGQPQNTLEYKSIVREYWNKIF